MPRTKNRAAERTTKLVRERGPISIGRAAVPDPGAIERFAELGQQFRKLWHELHQCHERDARQHLLQELQRVLTEADALVQRFNEDFRYWESNSPG